MSVNILNRSLEPIVDAQQHRFTSDTVNTDVHVPLPPTKTLKVFQQSSGTWKKRMTMWNLL